MILDQLKHSSSATAREGGFPPGPPGLPFLGNVGLFRQDRLGGMLQARADYGPIVHFQVGPRHVYLVSQPEMIKHVLQDNNRNYSKGRGLEKAKWVLGEGLLTSEGAFWRRQRRLAQPAFHRQHLDRFAQTMTERSGLMLERWEGYARRGEPFDVAGEMMQLTLDIAARTLFGTGVSAEETRAVAEAMPALMAETNRRITALVDLPPALPLPRHLRARRHIAMLDQVVFRIIEERRARLARGEESGEPDLLQLLITARDEESGATMDDRQLRDEVMTLFLAGHETTAINLAWTWALLSQHPAQRQRLHAEVDGLLLGRLATAADLPRLVFTRQVVDESLRLYPPAWIFSRQALGPDVLGGYPVRQGTGILISPYVVHRDPALWPNPAGFDPGRFAPETGEQRPRFAYCPFGGGPRQCIGNNFALMEATLVLATVSQQFALDLLPERPLATDPAFTLRPRGGVWVRALRRD